MANMQSMNRTEALRLADALSQGRYLTTDAGNPIAEAAAELRRLHAEVAQLREKRQPLSKEQRNQIERSNTIQGYHGDYYDAYGIMDDVEAAHNITGEPA